MAGGRGIKGPGTPPSLISAVVLAGAVFIVHLIANVFVPYGIFRDELYYLTCSHNLAFGYVDQPPLSLLILAVWRTVFGESLFAIRLFPALLHGATVILAGVLARDFGSGNRGILLACVATALSPIFLGFHTYYSMNSISILIWTLLAWQYSRLIRRPTPLGWMVFGVIAGLGLQNKIDVAWLGAGILVGLAITANRRQLARPWPWLAGGVAAVIFLPFVIWNATHGWPHLEFMRIATQLKYQSQTPVTFLVGQITNQNPLTVPLWLGGLGWLLLSKSATSFRPLAWIYLTAVLILLINFHSKPEYLAAAYVPLFAAGGVWFDRHISPRFGRWIMPTYTFLLVATGLAIMPLAMPMLPVGAYIKYARAIGMGPDTAEGHELRELPQFYADMFGWKEKGEAVATVYDALPDSDKVDCAIFSDNYGRCAAIDYIGRDRGLPPAIGNHNNYWLWGPRGHTGRVVIILGDSNDEHGNFESVERARMVTCDHCLPYEDSLTVFVCRNLNGSIPELWDSIRHFD